MLGLVVSLAIGIRSHATLQQLRIDGHPVFGNVAKAPCPAHLAEALLKSFCIGEVAPSVGTYETRDT